MWFHHIQPVLYEPTFGGYQLIGDSQFLRFSEQLLLKSRKESCGVSYLGLCVSGQKISELLQRIRDKSAAVSKKVVVMIGTNDLLRRTSIEAMCDDLKSLLDQLLFLGVNKIILLTLAPVPRLASDKDHWNRLAKYNQFIMECHNNENIFAVNAYAKFVKRNTIFAKSSTSLKFSYRNVRRSSDYYDNRISSLQAWQSLDNGRQNPLPVGFHSFHSLYSPPPPPPRRYCPRLWWKDQIQSWICGQNIHCGHLKSTRSLEEVNYDGADDDCQMSAVKRRGYSLPDNASRYASRLSSNDFYATPPEKSFFFRKRRSSWLEANDEQDDGVSRKRPRKIDVERAVGNECATKKGVVPNKVGAVNEKVAVDEVSAIDKEAAVHKGCIDDGATVNEERTTSHETAEDEAGALYKENAVDRETAINDERAIYEEAVICEKRTDEGVVVKGECAVYQKDTTIEESVIDLEAAMTEEGATDEANMIDDESAVDLEVAWIKESKIDEVAAVTEKSLFDEASTISKESSVNPEIALSDESIIDEEAVTEKGIINKKCMVDNKGVTEQKADEGSIIDDETAVTNVNAIDKTFVIAEGSAVDQEAERNMPDKKAAVIEESAIDGEGVVNKRDSVDQEAMTNKDSVIGLEVPITGEKISDKKTTVHFKDVTDKKRAVHQKALATEESVVDTETAIDEGNTIERRATVQKRSVTDETAENAPEIRLEYFEEYYSQNPYRPDLIHFNYKGLCVIKYLLNEVIKKLS